MTRRSRHLPLRSPEPASLPASGRHRFGRFLETAGLKLYAFQAFVGRLFRTRAYDGSLLCPRPPKARRAPIHDARDRVRLSSSAALRLGAHPMRNSERDPDDLRAELQRCVEEASALTDDLGDLPVGTWNRKDADDPLSRTDWMKVAKLAVVRIRELLAIPIDPAEPNYGTTIRGINSAISSALAFINRAEMLRQPPKEDILPKIIALMEAEEKNLACIENEDLLEDLIRLNDKQIDKLLRERRQKLAEPRSLVEQLANLNDEQVDQLLQTRRENIAAKNTISPTQLSR
jgi:hypothetical protein